MYFPQQIYVWLVNINVIPNSSEQDEKGNVVLPINIANNFDNGYLVSQTIKKAAKVTDSKILSMLTTVKADSSRNIKITNWNFIWLAFDAIEIKMDLRIKELILRGQQALIVQIMRKLYERYGSKNNNQKVNIKTKSSTVAKRNVLDFKKIDLQKDPENSQSSLQFLMLLLRASLGMNIQQILGLFTNQNKFFAQIIVKGVNSNFDPIILFYSLLNKHCQKLKTFNEKDLQACLLALKTGFISKNKKVAQLTIDFFGKLENIYQWFVSQRGQCLVTLLLGLKRHLDIKQMYWNLLIKIIKGQQLQFFTKYYPNSFQNKLEQIEVTTYLVKLISKSSLSEQLNDIGVFSGWLQQAHQLPQNNIQAQIINFRFIGELMLNLPVVINQNEDSLLIFQRKWYMKSLPQFVMLFNELITILEKLAENKSNMARKIYIIISQIAKSVSADKRDYLVQNFLLLVSKFTTIPAQHLILNLKKNLISSTEFLLFCECIEINENIETSISIGNLLKNLFLQQPLINFYAPTLLMAIISKAITNNQLGIPFLEKLIDQLITFYCHLQVKYKLKVKPNNAYFGRKETEQKVQKEQQEDSIIKQKWKAICLHFITSIVNLVLQIKDKENIVILIKNKMLDNNSKFRLNNHKIGIKSLQDILFKKFNVSKEQQLKHFQEYTKRYHTDLQESMLKKSKISQNLSVAAKLKGPQNLTKQLHQIAQKRKHEQQEKRKLELKKSLQEQKKKVNVKKELQITNLLRGQIGQAQLRQFGFLQRMVQQTKQLQVIPFDILEEREVDAIQSIVKKYHKLLRHLFLTYTWTMHNNHSNQKFQDNQQRKEILNAVQLGKMLKDYRLAFLTNQQEVNTLVRQINMKIFNKRDLNQLDFNGFQQFIIQFCALIMTKNHTITLISSQKSQKITHNFKNQPIHFILGQFFAFLKDVFISRGEKLTMFEDNIDLSISKDQSIQIQDYNKKIEGRPDYILPKGYKKTSQVIVEFFYKISPKINIPESYMIAVEILEDILSKQPFNTHIIESIAEKKTVYKVKPVALGKPPQLSKLRAMSNYIDRKGSLLIDKKFRQRKSTSKGISVQWQNIQSDKANITQIASQVVQKIVQKLETIENKQKDKKKRFASSSKLLQLQKSKNQYLQKKAKQKEQKKQAQLIKEKQQERKRREQTQKFLQQQKLKIAEKRRKQEQQRLLKQKEQQQKQYQKKQNKQKFKPFHQGQVQKIKKIEVTALQRIRKQKEHQKHQREKEEQQKKQLRVSILEEDKKIIELRKEGQQKIRALFESEPIRKVYSKYQPNLKALFDFLIQNTYLSLTQKKHNNQIIFNTWRHFFNIFQLSVIVLPKDIINIFKTLTKHKLISRNNFVGLNFRQFQEALLRISIKYKTILNLISQRIKDKIDQQPQGIIQQNEQSIKKKEQQPEQKIQKEGNQFDNVNLTIKDILKEHVQTIDSLQEYMDTSKVTNKTLLGLIYFLKIPNSKQGQQKRFRQILSNKHPSFAHQTQKLKEKLSQQYTLQSPTKKKPQAKISTKKISIPEKQSA